MNNDGNNGNNGNKRYKPPLICLMGPTACGKTDLAVALAERLDCELISVDSALVYRRMDIGSAKPDYPHHLVDIRDPAETYSAADFAADARSLVQEITERGRIPLLVGGTMLYFRAFLDGLADMPAADPAVRAAIEAQAMTAGWPSLHRELAMVDPDAAAQIHPNHSQRISRALEVYRSSGIPMTEWHRRENGHCDPRSQFTVRQLAIRPADRGVLHDRIAKRFQQMLAHGFLQEVQGLRAGVDLDARSTSMRAVGYRQLWRHLEGECSLDEAVEAAVAATRQLAKRQLTWLRKWPQLAWIIVESDGNGCELRLGGSATGETFGSPIEAALKYLDFAAG